MYDEYITKEDARTVTGIFFLIQALLNLVSFGRNSCSIREKLLFHTEETISASFLFLLELTAHLNQVGSK